jgi:hypothetical protein
MRRDDGSDIDALNEAHLTPRDGTPVLIRRLMGEDAALYSDFLSDVTAQDLRLRFFGPSAIAAAATRLEPRDFTNTHCDRLMRSLPLPKQKKLWHPPTVSRVR